MSSGIIVGLLALASAVSSMIGKPALGAVFSDPATAASLTSAFTGLAAIIAGILKGWSGK